VVEELGATRLIHGQIGTQSVTIAQDADLPVPTGTAWVSFRPEDTHLFDTATGKRL